MKGITRCAAGMLVLLLVASSAAAEEKIYWDVVQKIREEGFDNSHVMEDVSWLVDVFGPRNSKSSGYLRSVKWARDRLEEYGLSNARLEPFEFAVGWENKYTSVHMMTPVYAPILAYPAPWSAGTDGKITAQVRYVNTREIASEEDLEQYRGKLEGLIVFVSPIQPVPAHFPYKPLRFTDEELDAMSEIQIPVRGAEPDGRRRRGRGREGGMSQDDVFDFIMAQRAAAIVRPAERNGMGIVDGAVNGYAMRKRMWEADAPPPIREIILAAEHYNRIMRIMEKDIPVEMEIDIQVDFPAGDPIDYNVIAEIPGTDLAHEIVIVGGHLQSEPIGAGAIDNASGSVASMEAVRILKAIGVKPRRTIRIGLWGGHEMGTIGNRHHVRENFADVEKKEYKKDYHNLSAYFNVDIGTGRIRGVSIMGNEEMRSIFLEWIKPLKNLGMTHIYTTGSQHEAYREVGLPGFYFDHDRRTIDDMNSHTNMDLYERLDPDGLKQASVVLAALVYHAAMRDEKLPRIAPLPW